jgi:hypothetical protein
MGEDREQRAGGHGERYLRRIWRWMGGGSASTRWLLGLVAVSWGILGMKQGKSGSGQTDHLQDNADARPKARSSNWVENRVPIPLVAARNDRSPGIRVDAFPFGSPDLSSIWGMKCPSGFLELYLDASTGKLFALVDADAELKHGTLCTAYADGRIRHHVVFNRDQLQFKVSATPEHRPI